jgi:hypothetical protein
MGQPIANSTLVSRFTLPMVFLIFKRTLLVPLSAHQGRLEQPIHLWLLQPCIRASSDGMHPPVGTNFLAGLGVQEIARRSHSHSMSCTPP